MLIARVKTETFFAERNKLSPGLQRLSQGLNRRHKGSQEITEGYLSFQNEGFE